jgi:uncharacterized protein (TIGR02246 family)
MPTRERDSMDAAAIRRLYLEWIDAVREGDVDALAEMVTEDALFLATGAPPVAGREAVSEAYPAIFARHRIEQGFEEEELVIAGDWAFCRGLERFTATPRNGGPPVALAGRRALSILQKGADGRWRFARGMSNEGPRGERKNGVEVEVDEMMEV